MTDLSLNKLNRVNSVMMQSKRKSLPSASTRSNNLFFQLASQLYAGVPIFSNSRLEGPLFFYILLQHIMHLFKSRLVLDLVDRAVESSNVTWISPQQQDIYCFGSTILAKWASHRPLDILCLQFCMASSSPSACGVCVRPDVTESAGEYQVIMSVDFLAICFMC
jgi:hypothetical protein